ncbi:MFS transporter [Paenibacillus radicis (ex Xue et al. 2023)]|uniref:MFS transporter n=1 Tax=Paenibacillus radicis (ex Xue et al. 2023) TaxID=2972489 RepID=A0ABT1YCK3_9BACL|nr:MFS transporter [Paenibacillus radicis (ex Xue et al. 2023)]MCR8630922.1 MFS transporter [Paenibacillus radicis (ex Xue et al. 2023)]
MKSEYKVLRDNIRNNLWNGIFWSIGFNFVTPFIGVLASRLGATNSDYALLSSIPALLTLLLTLPASMIISRFRKQKRIVGGLILLCRFFYFLLIFVPYLNVSPIIALILLVGLYNAFNSVIAVAWQSMMGEILPASYRNRVLAQRNIWTGFCGMIIAFVAGWGIDLLPFPYGYQIAFSIGFAAAIVETWYFMKLRIPSEEIKGTDPESDLQLQANRQDTSVKWMERYNLNHGRAYYLFCLSAIIFIFSWQAVWPIFTKVKVDTLLATNTMMSIDTIIGAVGALLGFQLCARIADRRGTGWTLFGSALLLAITPYFWLHVPNMNWVYVYDFIGGIATAGFQQSIFNRLLEIVTDSRRQRAIAVYTTLTQVSAIFAPIVGMQLYSHVTYEACMTLLGSARVVGSLCFLVILSPVLLRWAGKVSQDRKQAL